MEVKISMNDSCLICGCIYPGLSGGVMTDKTQDNLVNTLIICSDCISKLERCGGEHRNDLDKLVKTTMDKKLIKLINLLNIK